MVTPPRCCVIEYVGCVWAMCIIYWISSDQMHMRQKIVNRPTLCLFLFSKGFVMSSGKSFTLAEVSSNKDLIVIDGSVYDISKFAKFHPGGEALLRAQGGNDVSEVFKGIDGNKHSH
jgi:cytochrome b involved in lipid metabolism